MNEYEHTKAIDQLITDGMLECADYEAQIKAVIMAATHAYDLMQQLARISPTMDCLIDCRTLEDFYSHDAEREYAAFQQTYGEKYVDLKA